MRDAAPVQKKTKNKVDSTVNLIADSIYFKDAPLQRESWFISQDHSEKTIVLSFILSKSSFILTFRSRWDCSERSIYFIFALKTFFHQDDTPRYSQIKNNVEKSNWKPQIRTKKKVSLRN